MESVEDTKIETYISIIRTLLHDHRENQSVLDKLDAVITGIPAVLVNHDRIMCEREERSVKRKKDQTEFKAEFLETNPYFYVACVSRFFYYDGVHYTIINEDDIQYNLFTCLSENKTLNSVKYRTQADTIREIKKTRTILNTIPESATVQFVMNGLSPVLFTRKADLKYFMIVVGNLILKQHQTCVHFVHPRCKPTMTFIEKAVMDTVGVNVSDNFKIRYHHNHPIEKCRLVRMNTTLEHNQALNGFFKQYCSDFISVCCYYSRRYKTEDEYVNRLRAKESKKYILYLATNSVSSILKGFRDEHFESASADQVISGKNMTFLWKWHINNKKIPNLLSVGSLREGLAQMLPYDKERDVYTHVECGFLGGVAAFVAFCGSSDTVVTGSDDGGDELDVSELIDVYHDENPKSEPIEESVFDVMVRHGLVSFKMKNSKTISGASCVAWDKRGEVMKDIVAYRASVQSPAGAKCYDAYEFYVAQEHKYVANKGYFERYFYNSA